MTTNDLFAGSADAPISLETWRRDVERRERLTDVTFVAAHVEQSIAAIRAVLEDGYTLRVAYSAGKDSTLLACLAIEAARLHAEATGVRPVLYVCSSDTGVENPEVVELMHQQHAAMREYGPLVGVDVQTEITRPRLSERWWPRIIGGQKLPSFAGGNADCSVDMKIKPMARLNRALDKALAASGRKPAVTLLGTRTDESAKRATAMYARGETKPGIRAATVGGYKALTLSPIADWPTETVWAYLQRAGRDRQFPGYAANFSNTYAMYDAAAGGACVIYEAPGSRDRGKGCSARMGCHTCQKVSRDDSMQNMLLLPEYAHLRPLAQLRDYLQATRFDWSLRRWVHRSVDLSTGEVKVGPNNYSATMCADLLRMVLTIDKREAARARAHAHRLESGLLEDTPAMRRLAQPQFVNIYPDDLIAIDFYWSLNALHPPHHALRLAAAVAAGPGELDVPSVAPTPRSPAPPVRRVSGDFQKLRRSNGMRDLSLEMVLFDAQGVTFEETASGIRDLPPFRNADAFEVDPESANLFFALEARRRIDETEGQDRATATTAARYYMRMGIVAYPQSHAHHIDRILRSSEFLNSIADLTFNGSNEAERDLASEAPIKRPGHLPLSEHAGQLVLYDVL